MNPEFIFWLLKSKEGKDISNLIPPSLFQSSNKGAVGQHLHTVMGSCCREKDFVLFEVKSQRTPRKRKSEQLPICNAVVSRMLVESFDESLWKRELERILLIQYSVCGGAIFCDHVYLFESPASILLFAEILYLRAQVRVLLRKPLVPDHVGGVSLRRKGKGSFGFFLSGKLVSELKLLSA